MGEANKDLTVEHAYKVGRYIGWYFGRNKDHAQVVIGKDTRRSSYMLEYALVAGLTASGADVSLMHVTTTPSVAYITRTDGFDCGIMISASHNPYYDNGIKVFNHNGEKMEEEVLLQIEDYIDGKSELTLNTGDKIGEYFEWQDGLEIYMSWLKEIVPVDLSGFKIAVDNANGSATSTAIETLDSLGATVEAISNSPKWYQYQ